MRAISDEFLHDLKEGMLSALTERVGADDTLMLALRGAAINIYYRGANILRLERLSGHYGASFHPNYGKLGQLPDVPNQIRSEVDCRRWLDAFPLLKELIDRHFTLKQRSEREFQQLVAWENNRSRHANSTEYFITDIEYAERARAGRFDMVGLKWLAKDKKTANCRPVFIEMKYGDDALEGTSGLKKHLDDFSAAIADPQGLDSLKTMIEDQFRQLYELGLVKFNHTEAFDGVKISGKPEVILLLASSNPRSLKLRRVIDSLKDPQEFDLRFFVASFAGFALHDRCMVSLADFRALLDGRAA